MYVCICNEVTDRHIREAANEGARNLKDLRYALNVATCCGSCSNCACKILDEYLEKNQQFTESQ